MMTGINWSALEKQCELVGHDWQEVYPFPKNGSPLLTWFNTTNFMCCNGCGQVKGLVDGSWVIYESLTNDTRAKYEKNFAEILGKLEAKNS